MIKIISFIFIILLCISFVFSDSSSSSLSTDSNSSIDSSGSGISGSGSSSSSSSSNENLYTLKPIIKYVKYPTIDKYASSLTNQCELMFGILFEYHHEFQESLQVHTPEGGIFASSFKNETQLFIHVHHKVPVGKNNPLSFTAKIVSVYPPVTWDFNNYAYADCEPLPSNLTIQSRQDKWQLVYDINRHFIWIKAFEVNGLEYSVSYGSLVCTVPQEFSCTVTEFFNGLKIKNFLVQILALSPSPFVPFNVVINDQYGRVLHSSPFDGLQSPSNPPPVVTNIQMFPPSGSTLTKKDITNNAMYLINVLNKNTIFNIATEGDYFMNSGFFPVRGNQANGEYIAFTPINGIEYTFFDTVTTHIQLIDSQGVKRISGSNVYYINEKYYENYTTNPVSSFLYSSNIESTLLNAKIDASYNPTLYINCESVNYFNYDENDKNKAYPWSYSNGTVQFHSRSTSCVDSPFSLREDLEIYVYIPLHTYFRFPNPEYNTNPNNYIIDRTSPIIKKVELIGALFEKVILRVHATDGISGISYFEVGSNNRIRASDLVYGNQFDGVYEFVVNFESYYLGTYPDFLVYDNAGNAQSVNYLSPVYNLDLDVVPEFPSYKYVLDNNIDPFSFSGFEFKYNDIDISNGPFNNTLCFNIIGADKNMIPRFIPLFATPLNLERVDLSEAIQGSWDYVKNMFCVNFQIPARLFSGELDYILLFTPNLYTNYYLTSTIGKQAQLRVTSSYADQMPPVITEFTAYPSNSVQINQSTNIGWDIKIEDSPNGLLSAEFNITSDYDLEPYTIKLTPSNAITGNLNIGTYQLRIPINSNTCRAQSFRITSASITDTQGHSSILPSTSNVNPLYRFLNSPQLVLNITCPQSIIDNTPPTLTSFTSSANTIDVGTFAGSRSITFTFTTSDSGSGISSRHKPYVFLNSPSYLTIKQAAQQLSNSNGIATYSTTIQLPYGYGAYKGILISIYGIVDNQLNINGYSTVDLQSLGFQSTIKVTYSDSPVLDTTSSINSTGTILTIYGHKFGIDQSKLTLQIDYQNNQGWINKPISFFSGIILMTNSITPTSTPFYVRVIVDGKISNSILVTPKLPETPCKYEVTQTVVSTWINSQIYHYLQAAITIKNTGNKPIKLFSFIMDNIDQIWGVTVNGNRYTLPSYNQIINPNDQYSFGYIIKGTTVGALKEIQYQCLV